MKALIFVIGLIIFFTVNFLLGIVIILIALFLKGSTEKIELICSECGNPVVETSKICPTCKIELD